jgi:hypothetical protein
VKRNRADDSAHTGVKVGHRQTNYTKTPGSNRTRGFFIATTKKEIQQHKYSQTARNNPSETRSNDPGIASCWPDHGPNPVMDLPLNGAAP